MFEFQCLFLMYKSVDDNIKKISDRSYKSSNVFLKMFTTMYIKIYRTYGPDKT